MASEALVVFSTAPNAEVGHELGAMLVRDRLAACVNVVDGVRSVYRWEGELQDDAEVLLMIKTDRDHLETLTAAVQRDHPYDCPEVIALPIVGGSGDYLAWLDAELASGSGAS